MNLPEAIEYARELGALKFFPSADAAVVKIGEVIAESCRDASEARWLVNEMIASFDEWPGPRMLKSVYDGQFAKGKARVFKGLGEKPPIDCQKCGDNGFVVRDGKYHRCDCPGGDSVNETFLTMLDCRTAPAKVERGGSATFTRITEADIAAALAAKGRTA